GKPCNPAIYVKDDKSYPAKFFGKRHRNNDLPAVIAINNERLDIREWFQNNKRHRDGDDPAVIITNKIVIYYKNGKIHRDIDKGPAIERPSGENEYWVNGKKLSGLEDMCASNASGNSDDSA